MNKIVGIVLTLIVAIAAWTGCKKSEDNDPKTFVLVAGAWQGAYVWDNVKAQLEKAGQQVIVVELPAHGDDNTLPVNTSIAVYRDKVAAAVNGISGKVILVGHSMAGVVVSAVAEQMPDKIEKLVYIAAFVPANGQSLADLAGTDAQSQLGPSLIPSADMLTLDIKTENRIAIFCQDGSDAVKALLTTKFRVEPAIPFGDKAVLSDAVFGRVDKYYIHTALDHAIGTNLQNQMVSAAHITKEYTLASGHSPFLSMPDAVTSTLLDISRK